MRISDWSSDVCSSDLRGDEERAQQRREPQGHERREEARVDVTQTRTRREHQREDSLQPAPHRIPRRRLHNRGAEPPGEVASRAGEAKRPTETGRTSWTEQEYQYV